MWVTALTIWSSVADEELLERLLTTRTMNLSDIAERERMSNEIISKPPPTQMLYNISVQISTFVKVTGRSWFPKHCLDSQLKIGHEQQSPSAVSVKTSDVIRGWQRRSYGDVLPLHIDVVWHPTLSYTPVVIITIVAISNFNSGQQLSTSAWEQKGCLDSGGTRV